MNKIETIACKLFVKNEACKCGGAHNICLGCAVCRAEEPDQLFDPESGIESIIDATILKADATKEEVFALCDIANDHKCASVCVNSYFSHLIQLRLSNAVKSCTVINFPLGAGCREAVLGEAKAAIACGIEELDMVQNLSAVMSGKPLQSYETVKAVSTACRKQNVLLKVILETCFLSEEELIVSCLYAKKAGAEFVKTSTGFGTAGATVENVALMRKVVGPKIGVKASGGIRTRETALAMIAAGANRIGASSVSALV
ncbi:MAG: deoxyribose-phosphate aldolase [Candidatus Cloacimonadaceae bacterium]|nr:deoxyribose-phosphate aldolase [Candidatus Cloacimonadaceae bacterium]MDP3115024.1 deoxyribose-phosphate aldolase [Candidatus Cloacimonadaceae bacterium]